VADRFHQALKRAQRRLLIADYEDLHLRRKWLKHDSEAPFDELSLPVGPDPTQTRTVLVFKPDEIGDAVYAFPAIAELRRALPEARFHLLCRPLTLALYERSGLFDEIATIEPGSRASPAGRLRLRRALATLSVAEFDLAIFLRTTPRGFRLFRHVPARELLHPLDPRMRSASVYRAPVSTWTDGRRHVALQLLEIAALVTRREYDFDDVAYPQLTWRDEDISAVAEVFGGSSPSRYFVLHPFAKDETRRYPDQYWPVLLDRLESELDVTWVVVGGTEDPPLPARENLIQSQGRLPLGATAYLLSRADGFIGNLSGPAHLAGALQVPTVTLMSGHSLPAEWAPLGKSLVLRADVPCAPCHQRTCPVYRLACLTKLDPDAIAPAITSFLRLHLHALA